ARAARRARTLRREDAIEVAVIWPRSFSALSMRIAFVGRVRDEGTERTSLRVLGVPVETVVLPWLALELLGIRPFAASGAVLGRVLSLRGDIGAGDGDRRQLVASDAAAEQLVLAGRGVEAPPVAAFHERNRERPGLATDPGDHRAVRQLPERHRGARH